MEVVFCEDVQKRLRFCLDRLNFVTMGAFQFYLKSKKQKNAARGHVRQVGWVFGQKFSGEKEM
jgi:hypothetical protein